MKSGFRAVVAVSGSTGLIGGEMASELAKHFTVKTVGRSKNCDLYADFSNVSSIGTLPLSGCYAFVHCAGIIDEDLVNAAPSAFVRCTIGLTALLEACARSGVERFVYISTSHVYGPPQGHTDEMSRINPLSLYAICHFAAEQTLKGWAENGKIRALVLRPNAVFGVPRYPDRFRRWHLIPFSFPREAVRNRRIVLRTQGRQMRNFVGTADLAEAVAAYLNLSHVPAWLVVNPLGAADMSVRDFAHLCAAIYKRVAGDACEVVCPVHVPDEPGADFRYESVSGWKRGQASVEKFVENMMEWFLVNKKDGTL